MSEHITLSLVARLAREHPEVQFVIDGDSMQLLVYSPDWRTPARFKLEGCP